MPPTRVYNKTGLSIPDLVTHLTGRGLAIADPAKAADRLERIGYYRLLVYLRAFQTAAKDFLPGTSFEDVLELYEFDRKLRLVCLDAIERIEVALRSAIVQKLAVPLGPHFYLDVAHYERPDRKQKFLDQVNKARYLGLDHYRQTYLSPAEPPIWTALEAVTLGDSSYLFADLKTLHRKAIAAGFGHDEQVIVSWFKCLTVLRNMCAHHNRLWNFRFRVNMPILARTMAAAGIFAGGDSLHTRAVILTELLNQIAPGNSWKAELKALVQSTPGRDALMGFPAGWQTHPFWN